MKSKLFTTGFSPIAVCIGMAVVSLFVLGTQHQVSAYEDVPWRCEFCDSVVWPPGQSHAHMATPPLTILNPFVEQPDFEIEPPVVVTRAPLTILNPFCKQQ